jgi:tight adherence protein B
VALSTTVFFALTSSIAAGTGGFLLMADRRERLSNQRLLGIVRSYRPVRPQEAALRRSASEGDATSAVAGLLPYMGVKAERPDLYPVSWKALLSFAAIAALAVEILGFVLIGPVAWFGLPVAWVLLARKLFQHYDNRRNKLLYHQLPDALSMIVRSVRVGVAVQDSLRVVSEEAQSPTSIEFRRLTDDIRMGSSLGEALLRLADRSGLIEYRFFAVALALQNQSGGSLSETLENLADICRKRVALRARAIALASEARLTMYVLAGLPFFAIGALLLIDPDYLTILFTTSSGKKLILGGIGLLTMGLFSMRLIIRTSTS